jgi:hypothetical protein
MGCAFCSRGNCALKIRNKRIRCCDLSITRGGTRHCDSYPVSAKTTITALGKIAIRLCAKRRYKRSIAPDVEAIELGRGHYLIQCCDGPDPDLDETAV